MTLTRLDGIPEDSCPQWLAAQQQALDRPAWWMVIGDYIESYRRRARQVKTDPERLVAEAQYRLLLRVRADMERLDGNYKNHKQIIENVIKKQNDQVAAGIP